MTDTQMNRPPVTVPIGLGGKTAPYVPDPAPTLVVEFPSVETSMELARIESLEEAARDAAQRIVSEATAAAEETRREAAEAADELRSAAETEHQALLLEVATEREALAAERAELAQQSEDLDDRQAEFDIRRSALDDRLARADDDVAEAARMLADARAAADAIMEEARAAADSMIQEATSQAQTAAAELIGEARDSVDAETLIAQRLSEVELMHRVEIQVLTEREAELLDRIAHLEGTAASAQETVGGEVAADDEEDGVAAEHEPIEIRESPARNGRHTTDVVDVGTRAITSHTTLTEQLSTSAFRASGDRKGRRRR